MQASELAQSVRRQRECAECGNRFLTSERVDPRGFVVVKRDGRREEVQSRQAARENPHCLHQAAGARQRPSAS